jgi:UDP-GlcNAc:undecaprenyl-phosphate GlcNAc-1-phosphate transferase
VSLLTLLIIFVVAIVFSTILTYVVRWLGVRLGAVDVPMARKVHTTPIPRIGGLAVFVSFVAMMAIMNLFSTRISESFHFDHRATFGFYGALVVFGCGLWDDFRRLNPWIKLLFQIVGASLAFAGGISISGIFFDGHGIQFGILSYLVTVFWFLLFINAVNLIDGLDGLAGGVVFFTCLLMVILSVMSGNYPSAVYFTALGGAVMGFLRFNFNPASIFLGDGGSYFLGYAIAALAIMGSVKSQVSALMLIPLLALGVPMFDTLLAPLRRWIKGRRVFQPDRGHIHHRLLEMGLSSQKAVLVIYGLTLVMCLLAILIVVNRNDLVGMVLILLLVGVLAFVRKNGYLEYLALDKFYGWFKDMTDVAGFSRERRTFLALQMEANKARTLEEMLETIGDALEMLRFDRAELHLKNRDSALLIRSPHAPSAVRNDNGEGLTPYAGPDRRKNRDSAPLRPRDELGTGLAQGDKEGGNGGGNPGNGAQPPAPTSTKIFEEILELGDEIVWKWTRGYYRRQTDVQKEEMLKIDLPLHKNGNGAHLILMKDLSRDPLQYFTLRRLEHLRRTIRYNLTRLQNLDENKKSH